MVSRDAQEHLRRHIKHLRRSRRVLTSQLNLTTATQTVPSPDSSSDQSLNDQTVPAQDQVRGELVSESTPLAQSAHIFVVDTREAMTSI